MDGVQQEGAEFYQDETEKEKIEVLFLYLTQYHRLSATPIFTFKIFFLDF